MLVSIAIAGLVVWLIVCGIFLGLIGEAQQPAEARVVESPSAERDEALAQVIPAPKPRKVAAQVPVELIVYRLEDYIRAEEAAAESYLQEPSAAALRAGTAPARVV